MEENQEPEWAHCAPPVVFLAVPLRRLLVRDMEILHAIRSSLLQCRRVVMQRCYRHTIILSSYRPSTSILPLPPRHPLPPVRLTATLRANPVHCVPAPAFKPGELR